MKPKHIEQKAWDKALQLLETAPSKWRGGSCDDNVCAGTYVEEDGELFSNNLSGYVCHAFAERPYAGRHLFFNTMNRKFYNENENTVKAVEAFCRWMKDKSPVRKFILNEDYESMYHGGIIIDCTRCPSNVLLWICKAFRAAYEDPWRIPIWFKLVELDVHPMLALCFAQCANRNWLDQETTTHCSCMAPPLCEEDVAKLFVDHVKCRPPVKPEAVKKIDLDEDDYYDDDYDYDDGCWETVKVFRSEKRYGKWKNDDVFYLPSKGEVETVPDGWGGYIMKTVKTDAAVVAKNLKKIQKEYM